MADLVTIVCGGPSAEHDISILTGLLCERVLQRAQEKVQVIYWDRGGVWHLVPSGCEARDFLGGAPDKSTRLTLHLGSGADDGFHGKAGMLGKSKPIALGTALLTLHGGAGEGGGVQSLFETLGVPATGSSPQAAALGMDKLAFAGLMESAQVPTLPRRLVATGFDPGFAGPYIVKPRFGGSSIGIEVTDDYPTALALLKTSQHMRAGAVVEPFRDDLFDVNISFCTAPTLRMSLIEKPHRSSDRAIYDYAGKYMSGGPDGMASVPRELPADLPADLSARINDLAAKVAALTGLTGINRVDFLTDGKDQVFVNEVNSIPGSMGLYLWPNDKPEDLLRAIVAEASTANRRIPTASFEEGAALKAASGISGKLTGLGPSRS